MLLREDSASGAIPSVRLSVSHSAGAAPRGTTLTEYDRISFKEVLQVLQLIAGGRVSDGLQTPYGGPRGSPRSGNHVLLEPQTALQVQAPAATPPGVATRVTSPGARDRDVIEGGQRSRSSPRIQDSGGVLDGRGTSWHPPNGV